MFGLALRSLRLRAASFSASFLAIFLGAMMVMTFASLLDTSLAEGVPEASAEIMTIMANAVGGWGALLVIFAVAATLTLSVQQRAAEMALLKCVGATPGQVGWMIVGEAAVLAVLGGLLAVAPALLAGRAVLRLLIDAGQVAPGVAYAFGPIALGMGLGITFVSALAGAALTARRAARMRATESLVAAAADRAKLGRVRVVAALSCLAGSIILVVLTVTVMHGAGYEAMATAGYASIIATIGLGLLGPLLLRRITALLVGPLERLAGVSGYLTARSFEQRSNQLAAALLPIILFTGIATGTLYMQEIENAITAASGAQADEVQRTIETLNFVVVGMVSLFLCIMLINTLVAAILHRRREFGQLRLAGATSGEVTGMVLLEGVVLAAAGVLVGTLAAPLTILAYSFARTDSLMPDATLVIYLGIVLLSVAVTLATGVVAARRALRIPAIETVAGI
ncbi:MAG TPA: FtsX-like permease family protein [Micromonosporaceae bacterium]|nr:FtsX-like permease family protein [Micromonosporaceae bacterium]